MAVERAERAERELRLAEELQKLEVDRADRLERQHRQAEFDVKHYKWLWEEICRFFSRAGRYAQMTVTG